MRLCEHHPYENANKRMREYGLTRYKSPGVELLKTAFRSPADLRRFRRVAGDYILLDAWAESVDAAVLDQVKRRLRLPDHHSTGALDARLAKVRDFMEPRAFCCRNAERTNRLLELVRLRLTLGDNRDRYALAVRTHLVANGGRLGTQGAVRDPHGHHSLRA